MDHAGPKGKNSLELKVSNWEAWKICKGGTGVVATYCSKNRIMANELLFCRLCFDWG